MGGYIIKTDIDIAMENSRINEFISLRNEDGYSKRRIVNGLVKRFQLSVEAAKERVAEYFGVADTKPAR